jgi:ectoine utilization protein EutC
MGVHILTETDLRSVVGIDRQSLDAVATAFSWLQQGLVDMPPIMHISARKYHGDIDVKSAYVDGVPVVAIKIASGFFNNPDQGLPAGSAMMVLLSAETGFCKAVLLDNGFLTDLRTGMAGAVAADLLAPGSVETVGIVGTGMQARFQLQCLSLVRPFRKVLVWGRDQHKVAKYIQDMQSAMGVTVEAADLETVTRQSQVVITTTPGNTPLIKAEWLHPGLFICAVGADFPGKQELDADVLRKADRVVCDRLSQCTHNGELQHLCTDGALPKSMQVDELGQLTTGLRPGRQDASEVIVCDLTGTGVQDTAIANLAYQAAMARGLGSEA